MLAEALGGYVKKLFSFDTLFLIIAILFVLAFFIWGPPSEEPSDQELDKRAPIMWVPMW